MLPSSASLYAAFSAPEDGAKTAFSGVFNKVAASFNGPKRFAHCALLFKVDSLQEIGFHTSICWGGTVFCEPVPINIENNTVTLPKVETSISRPGGTTFAIQLQRTRPSRSLFTVWS